MRYTPECLHIQTFAAQGPVKPFIGTVLPGAAGIDVPKDDSSLLKPPPQGLGHKLRAIVGSYELRGSVTSEQPQEGLGHDRRIHAPSSFHGQCLTGVFILHGQNFEVPAIVQRIKNEIVRPDMVGILGPAGRSDALSTPFARFSAGQRQALLLAQSPNSLHVELLLSSLPHPLTPNHLMEHAVAVTRITPGQVI